MKQKLFALMSVAALLASCSNDDFLTQAPSNEAPKSAGIVFNLVDEATTRGEFTTDEAGNFATSWNAETDRIGIIYSGAVKGLTTDVSGAKATLWNGIAAAKRDAAVSTPEEIAYTTAAGPVYTPALAIYKTTRSGASGWVTAVDDANILKFAKEEADPDDQVKASFRAIRPVAVNGDGTVTPSVKYSNTATGVETMEAAVPAFHTQTQSSLKAEFNNFFMVAAPINNIYSASNAVGEELALAFERPFAALAVRTKGYNKDVYGNLKSVTVTMTSSDIACSAASKVDIAKKDKNGAWVITPNTKEKSVKLTIGASSGLEWSDDAYAFIQILPIDRTTLDAAEKYTVKLEFAKGDITINKSTSNNWTANSFVKVTCDLDNENYLYLTAGGANTLIINKAMPTLTGDKGSKKFDGNAASGVKTLVAKIALTANELKAIKEEFTGITSMTLANQSADLGSNLANVATSATAANVTDLTLTAATSAPVLTGTGVTTLSCPVATSIPANAFNGNTTLAKAYFPVVATIGDNAFTGATQMTTIGCADTDKLQIGTTKKNVKSSALTSIGTFSFSGITGITKVDAPELTTMGARAFGNTPLANVTTVLLPKYDFENTYNAIALLSGTALTTADLSAVPELGATTIAFTNITSLTTVTLKQGVNVGMSAFAGCSSLVTVKNLDKAATIGENAFKGTALTKALVNVATIGKNAFNGCTSLATLTLGANVTAISEGAFNGCSALGTINNLANVTSIGKNAFYGTAITTFDFLNASMAEGAFQNCTALVGQVRSNATSLEKNVFNGDNKVSNFVFPNVTTIKEGALASLLGTAPFATITFGSALTSIHQKAFCTPATATTEMDGSTAKKAITGTANYNLILTDKTGLSIDGVKVTFVAADGKYYKITFKSVQ